MVKNGHENVIKVSYFVQNIPNLQNYTIFHSNAHIFSTEMASKFGSREETLKLAENGK